MAWWSQDSPQRKTGAVSIACCDLKRTAVCLFEKDGDGQVTAQKGVFVHPSVAWSVTNLLLDYVVPVYSALFRGLLPFPSHRPLLDCRKQLLLRHGIADHYHLRPSSFQQVLICERPSVFCSKNDQLFQCFGCFGLVR